MSLKQWLDNGWLRNHKTSKNEIDNLMMIVEPTSPSTLTNKMIY